MPAPPRPIPQAAAATRQLPRRRRLWQLGRDLVVGGVAVEKVVVVVVVGGVGKGLVREVLLVLMGQGPALVQQQQQQQQLRQHQQQQQQQQWQEQQHRLQLAVL